MTDWVDLSPHWEEMKRLAADRSTKSGARLWRSDPNFLGFCGEFTYAISYGGEVDTTVTVGGDKGRDFDFLGGTLDVKAITVLRGHLLQPVHHPHWPNFFALAVIHYEGKRGRIEGIVPAASLRACATKTFISEAHAMPMATVHKCHLALVNFLE